MKANAKAEMKEGEMREAKVWETVAIRLATAIFFGWRRLSQKLQSQTDSMRMTTQANGH